MIAPTIIVGVGGRGSDICCRVSKLVGNSEQRKRLRFVCIDTDINDLNNRKKEDSRIRTIQISAPYMVCNYLSTNTRAQNQWFPTHNILMGKTPTEGAGQVRAISRLAFDEAVREGKMQVLEKTIEELYFLDGSSEPQAVRIMIVSTLAGGTGSGIVLPVALYIRNFLETRFRKNASIIRGFFLLPEIMFGGKSPEERASLCCNAYASIRELDAFMRRGDGALGNKYKDLKLELPDPTTGKYVDYHVSPFNFCFLYDKRNSDDLQLLSFEDYIEHAANTIYTQTVSGISSRSNSNEDNAIKDLVKSDGRNRYCGAGSSLMKYPRDSVLKYIAGKWCTTVMNDNWLKIDKQYTQYLQNQREARKKNPGLKDMTLQDFYINAIQNGEKNSFEEQIKIMCSKSLDDSSGKIMYESKIEDYMGALTAYVRDVLKSDPDVIGAKNVFDTKYKAVFSFINKEKDSENNEDITMDTIPDDMQKLMELGEQYVSKVKQAAGRAARILEDQIFSSSLDHTEDDKPYRIETYMKDEDKNFIHPNAARFFMYQLEKRYRDQSKIAYNGMKQLSLRINPYDDAETPEIETARDYMACRAIVKKYLGRFQRLDRAEIEEIDGKMTDQVQTAPSFGVNMAMSVLCQAAADHMKVCNGAFEVFYNNFEGYLKATNASVAEIERRFVNGEGKATRYVCSSKKCLQSMLEEMPCSGADSNINGPLSAVIYQKVIEYAREARKPNPSFYFQKTFDEHIMKAWENIVLKNYQTRIDMDILSALEAEAEYESDEPLTGEQKTAYAVDKLKQAERLAAPFIEEPMGEIRHIFNICAYNPAIKGEADSARRSFVKRYLNDEMNGQEDENVSIYELMIYKAIYDMCAGDLKRFRAPENAHSQGGVYYASYFENIRRLGPDTNHNRVLTPHIDKRWHLVKYLPDLDDRNQRVLEKNLYTALCWGMITGKIEQTAVVDEIDEKKRILYRPTSLYGDEFVVSNGSKCDELYEVADALGINPPQIEEILKDYRDTLEKEKMECVDLYNSKLISCMNWNNKKGVIGIPDDNDEEEIFEPFRIRQFLELPFNGDQTLYQKPSIFDLIYWIKVSTPAKEFSGDDVRLMLTIMLEMLEEYVGEFVGEEKKYIKCYKILADQFQLFLDNLKDENIQKPKNRLEDSCVYTIRVSLNERIRNLYKMESEKCDIFTRLFNHAESEQTVKAGKKAADDVK